MNGRQFIGRRTLLPLSSLEWELGLLHALAAQGIRVPLPVPTLTHAAHQDGLVLSEKIEGPHPDSVADWRAVIAYLSEVARCAEGYADLHAPAGRTIADCDRAAGGMSRPDLPRTSIRLGRVERRNFTMTPDGPTAVDWSKARKGDMRLDLAPIDLLIEALLLDSSGNDEGEPRE